MQVCVSFKSQYCAYYAVEATVSLILIQIMKLKENTEDAVFNHIMTIVIIQRAKLSYILHNHHHLFIYLVFKRSTRVDIELVIR